MVNLVEGAWDYMVAIVPATVRKPRVVRVVHHHLVLGDTVARPVFKLSIRQFENFIGPPASKRRLPFFCGYRRPHILEYHHVVSRHCAYPLLVLNK